MNPSKKNFVTLGIFYVWLFDLKQQMGNFIPNVYIKEDVYGILPTVYKSERISIF